MTPLRALFFLAAVTAACAATIPAKVQDADSLETHIALLAHHRFTANPIESAIDKIKELVRRIEERIKEAESELLDALQATSTAVVKKVNDFILSKTGVDLQLDKKLEAFEKKAEGCNAQFKKSLKDVVDEIKTETESCAAAEVAAVKEISEQIVALVDILKVVPPQTISKIKACSAAPAPDAPTPAPPAPTPVPEALRGVHSVGSWSDLWREAKCVTKVLADASKELVEVPDAIEKVVSDIAALSGKDTREAVKKCAEQSIAGKPEVVQEAAAQLAYCVIAPSKQ